MVDGMTDADLRRLSRGGHDYRKVYAAFAAPAHTSADRPSSWRTPSRAGRWKSLQGRNATHQMKKLTKTDLKEFRDRLHLPITDAALEADLPPYYHPGMESEEIQYMLERRRALGGSLPSRVNRAKPADTARRHGLRRVAARVWQAEKSRPRWGLCAC